MSFLEDYSTRKGQDSLAWDFASSAFDAGIQRPVNSLSQLANKLTGAELPELNLVQPSKPASDSHAFAQQAGSAVGMILPFLAARGAVRSTVGGAFVEGRVASMALEGGATGFVYGFGLTPATDKSSFWASRMKNGLAEAGTFATLSGVAGTVSKSGLLRLAQGDSLATRVLKGSSIGALSGAPAGLVSAESHSLLDGKGMASTSELLHGMRDMAIFGTVFSGAKAGFSRPMTQVVEQRVNSSSPLKTGTVGSKSVAPEFAKTLRPGELTETAKTGDTSSTAKTEQVVARTESVVERTESKVDRTEQPKPADQAAPEKVLKVNRSGRLGEGDEGTVYSNGDGSVTKVYFDNARDMSAVAKMFQRLEDLGLNLPKVYEWGRTADGKPAIRMQQVGDGDPLKMQLITGELSRADRISLNQQYYSTADLIQKAGIRIDWNLKNMRFESGKLYILDPSFLKEEPMAASIVQLFSGPIGPRIQSNK